MPLLWEHIPAQRVRARSSLFSRTLIREAKVINVGSSLAWYNEASCCNNKQKEKQDMGQPTLSHLSSSPTKEENNPASPRFHMEHGPQQTPNFQKRGHFISNWLSLTITKSSTSVVNVRVRKHMEISRSFWVKHFLGGLWISRWLVDFKVLIIGGMPSLS